MRSRSVASEAPARLRAPAIPTAAAAPTAAAPTAKLIAAALALTLAGVAALGAAGCGPKSAAVVNGKRILMSQVDAEIESMRKDHPQVFEGEEGAKMETQFRKRIVDNLVANILVAQEAEAQGVTVTDAEIDKKIASMEAQFHSKQQFQEALSKSGTTLEALRERIRLQLITARMVSKITASVKITEQEAKGYYKINREVFKTDPKARVRLIKLPAGSVATAKAIRDDIAGGQSFAALARRESTDEGTKDKGGDTGLVALADLPTDVAPAVRTATKGDLLGPIAGQDAVYVVQVLEISGSRQETYEEAKEKVYSVLKQEREVKAFNDWIESLKKKADVQINI